MKYILIYLQENLDNMFVNMTVVILYLLYLYINNQLLKVDSVIKYIDNYSVS